VICRDATAGDVAWMTEVALDAYHLVFAAFLPGCDWSAFDAAHFHRRFNESWPRIRIAEDGAPCGFALVTLGHIDMFFIDRTAQGRGLGAVLLADVASRGALSLESFAVNRAARRFYERAGWVATEHSSRPFAGVECDFVRYERL
jgi:GNAT superfamily N-acetyltransferase